MCGNYYITEVAVKSFQQPVVACTRVCSQPHHVLWSPYTCVRFRYGAEQCVVKQHVYSLLYANIFIV